MPASPSSAPRQRLWRRLNLRPDVVLSSPLPRARQTADVFVAGVGLKRVPIDDDRLRPGADWSDMARALADYRDARRVMFVGHEPDLSEAVCLLTGARAVGCARAGWPASSSRHPRARRGELAWLLDPDLYAD